jgi:hypothetical protein
MFSLMLDARVVVVVLFSVECLLDFSDRAVRDSAQLILVAVALGLGLVFDFILPSCTVSCISAFSSH